MAFRENLAGNEGKKKGNERKEEGRTTVSVCSGLRWRRLEAGGRLTFALTVADDPEAAAEEEVEVEADIRREEGGGVVARRLMWVTLGAD